MEGEDGPEVVEQPSGKAEQEAGAQESIKAKQSDELKVVIILNAGKVMLGVQSPDCDPVYTTLKGTLAVALKRIPKLVDEAKLKWSESPRYPDAKLPVQEPKPTSARTPVTPKKKEAQPSFF